MTTNINHQLYQRVKNKGFEPSHVAEVGVWHPNTSNIYQYIQDGIKTTLIEPDPASIELIKSHFGNKNNVTLYENAVCDFRGEVDLYKRESSTFVSLLSSSPTLVNDDFDIQKAEKFTAKAKLFSDIDDGTIDLISIDTEGSEWFVIKNMISRPAVISIETHGGMYINPYLNDILKWTDDNNYILWYKNNSDSIFVQKNVISVSLVDRIKIVYSEIIIFIKSVRKSLKKNILKIIK
jgi:FkbM family methyltransferase